MAREPSRAGRRHGPVTLLEVARRARVAKSTASRAISTPGRVSEKTAARVLKAAAELNYVSHGVARALSTRTTRTVGAVIPTLDNAIYAVSTHSLEQRLQKAGYMLLVACHEFDLDAETRAVESLISRGADAIALVGFAHRRRTLEILARSRVPYVLTWSHRAGAHPSVGFDNREAGRLAADYLLRLGHRHFGVIAGIMKDNDRASERMKGIRDALADGGVPLRDGYVVEKPYSIEGGREGLSMLVARRPRPTAIICGNDILAIGAMHEAGGRRLRIPEELSITGFDDMPMAAVASPPLTTVHFPMAEVGTNAAAYLLNALGAPQQEVHHDLPVRLVVRASAGPPPSRSPRGAVARI